MSSLRNSGPLLIIIIAMVILNALNGEFSDIRSWLLDVILMLPGIVIGLSFHEFAHGFVSDRLGDPTPRMQGRLTLNPAAHIDPVGFVCLMFAGFGWGVPVQIDPRYYKHRRRDEFLVSIAGVVMNFILAICFALIIRVIVSTGNSAVLQGDIGGAFYQILQHAIQINIVLMVFNLIPVPPLDGFGIITQIFDLTKYSWYYPLYSKGFLILLILILFNLTDKILSPAIMFIYMYVLIPIMGIYG